MQYTQYYDEFFPNQSTQDGTYFADPNHASHQHNWALKIQPYIKSFQIYSCPSATPSPTSPPVGDSRISYLASGVIVRGPTDGIFDPPVKQASIVKPSELIMAHEMNVLSRTAMLRPFAFTRVGNDGFEQWMHSAAYNDTHFEGGNLLYVDGHVKWKSRQNICARDFGLNNSTCGQYSNGSTYQTIPLDTSIIGQ